MDFKKLAIIFFTKRKFYLIFDENCLLKRPLLSSYLFHEKNKSLISFLQEKEMQKDFLKL